MTTGGKDMERQGKAKQKTPRDVVSIISSPSKIKAPIPTHVRETTVSGRLQVISSNSPLVQIPLTNLSRLDCWPCHCLLIGEGGLCVRGYRSIWDLPPFPRSRLISYPSWATYFGWWSHEMSWQSVSFPSSPSLLFSWQRQWIGYPEDRLPEGRLTACRSTLWVPSSYPMGCFFRLHISFGFPWVGQWGKTNRFVHVPHQ